jgi:hypothetical protein
VSRRGRAAGHRERVEVADAGETGASVPQAIAPVEPSQPAYRQHDDRDRMEGRQRLALSCEQIGDDPILIGRVTSTGIALFFAHAMI